MGRRRMRRRRRQRRSSGSSLATKFSRLGGNFFASKAQVLQPCLSGIGFKNDLHKAPNFHFSTIAATTTHCCSLHGTKFRQACRRCHLCFQRGARFHQEGLFRHGLNRHDRRCLWTGQWITAILMLLWWWCLFTTANDNATKRRRDGRRRLHPGRWPSRARRQGQDGMRLHFAIETARQGHATLPRRPSDIVAHVFLCKGRGGRE